MRARGRPADDRFLTPGPLVHHSKPGCRSLESAVLTFHLRGPMRLLAAPHAPNPSGARAKILPRQRARPAAARARLLSRVPPRAGPAYHVCTTPPARRP